MNKIKYSNLNQTIIYHNKDKGLYFKSSYDKNSIKSLNNEYEGFNWYFSKKPELDKSFTYNLKKTNAPTLRTNYPNLFPSSTLNSKFLPESLGFLIIDFL